MATVTGMPSSPVTLSSVVIACMLLPNVKEHAPTLVGASVGRGAQVENTVAHETGRPVAVAVSRLVSPAFGVGLELSSRFDRACSYRIRRLHPPNSHHSLYARPAFD